MIRLRARPASNTRRALASDLFAALTAALLATTTLPDGLSWVLPAGADVVLLAHLQPLGRPERLQPSIGFYFTDVPPTNSPLKLGLRSYTLDLPAGASNVVVEPTVVFVTLYVVAGNPR